MLDSIMLRLFAMFTVRAFRHAEAKAVYTVNALAAAAVRKYGSEVL